ncbi:MAG: hypothetical protein GDA43_20730 [Hormoscilla sp. SP5CHS1]|nr:hypothetical protein [Hormoscilla sp. SP12CHS1]MBC6455325.1 hypothetical protein [Hormoscilla sp. SP5CHS1]
MTDYQPDRLDRIEALVEKIGQIVESNARALEAMTDNIKKWQQESQIYRSRLDQLMAQTAQTQAQVVQTQAQVAQTQANFYERPNELDKWQEELSRRKDKLAEIMQFLTQKK